MPLNRIENSRAERAPEKDNEPVQARASGFKSWLPLLANLLLMPALAYVTITFVVLPDSGARGATVSASRAETSGGQAGAGERTTAPLSSKILVNVAGTMGTRYLLANITLVSNHADLQRLIDKHDAELRDAAAGTLGSKTIADLEKPGARNLIRTELLSVFNNVLGPGVVTEIYLTEFAIQ